MNGENDKMIAFSQLRKKKKIQKQIKFIKKNRYNPS